MNLRTELILRRSEYDWKVVDPVVDAIHAMAEQEGFTKKTGFN
jgi:hypothetical protein